MIKHGHIHSTTTFIALRRSMFGFVALLMLLLVGLPAQAKNYVFPGNLPSGCSGSSGTYSCGTLTLSANDTVTIASPKPATIKFSGAFTTGIGTLINASGAASDLTIVSTGVITLGANAVLNSNVNGSAAINLGIGSTVGGYLSTDAGAISIGDGGSVGGSITTDAGAVTLAANIKVEGSISTVAGGISIGDGTTICANVITTGAGVVTLTTNIKVGGVLSSTAGGITIGAGSTVGGNIGVVGAGVVTLTSVLVGGNISTVAGAINLTSSRVGGSVAASGAGVVTLTSSVINDKTLSIPGVCVAIAIAEYRFDESSAGSVIDSSGNSLNGTLKGGVTVGGKGKICNGYNFNGSSGFVSVPNNALLNSRKVTVAAWVRHNATAIKDWEAILTKGDSAYRIHLNGGCSINGINTSGGMDFGVNDGCSGADLNSDNVPASGTWYHVVGTYDGAKIKIYVNGALTASSAFVDTLNSNNFPLYIGENSGQTGRFFSGDIDEVKVYNAALTAAQISTGYANENAGGNWDGTARVCLISTPDHFEIQHASGTGLTCAASTLTIKACTNAACITPYTGGVNGTLTATGAGMAVNWDGTTGGATGAGFVIAPGSSSVTKNVQVATAGSVVFGMTSPPPAPTSTTICNFGAPSCTFTAGLAGFIFSATSTGNASPLSAQVAGIATSTWYLRAVQTTTANPAVCTPAIIGQTTAVNMGYACNNPTTCQTGNLATINTTAIAGSPSSNPTQYSTPVSLSFDANGSAPITVRYDDVGQITLYANKTVTPTNGTAITLNGSSNSFVVAPHHFGFSNITAGLIKAGNSFTVTATSYNGLGTPTITANFGKETAPQGVVLTATLVSPVVGNSPAVGNSTILGGEFGAGGLVNDANGVATVNNLNWSEVGLITLTANLSSTSYLGSALTATGTSGSIGRFIPHHFDTLVTQPEATFTYSGQPFTTKVTARSLTGTATTNYNATAGFSKGVTLSAWNGLGVIANPGPGAMTPVQPPAMVLASAFTSTSTGAATVSTPTYTFSTAKTAPNAIKIRAVDTDLVSSADGVNEGTAVIRSGRLRVSNAFGTEKTNLSMAIAAEYWTGLSWVLNSDDSYSLIPATAVALTPIGVVNSTVQGSVTLSGGQASIVLLKPTSGTGFVDLAINLGIGSVDQSCLSSHPATAGAGLPWLRSLNGNCATTYDRDPSARGSFGIYSPETKKTIHIREIY
jgi:MSHA biogenesis protein MshQ